MSINLPALGLSTDLRPHDDEDYDARVQGEGRALFSSGVLAVFDTGSMDRPDDPPGRLLVEPFSGRGQVGTSSDLTKRIHIEENDAWAQVFAKVVAVSAASRARSKARGMEIEPGDTLLFERCAAVEPVRVATPSSLDGKPALFRLLHVDDVYAVLERGIHPLADALVLKRLDEEVSAGGVIFPQGWLIEEPGENGEVEEVYYTRPPTNRGLVLLAGPQVEEVNVGEPVFFSRGHGVEINFGGGVYLVIREQNVLARDL